MRPRPDFLVLHGHLVIVALHRLAEHAGPHLPERPPVLATAETAFLEAQEILPPLLRLALARPLLEEGEGGVVLRAAVVKPPRGRVGPARHEVGIVDPGPPAVSELIVEVLK